MAGALGKSLKHSLGGQRVLHPVADVLQDKTVELRMGRSLLSASLPTIPHTKS